VLIADLGDRLRSLIVTYIGKILDQILHVRGDAHNARSIHGSEGKYSLIEFLPLQIAVQRVRVYMARAGRMKLKQSC